MLQQTRSDKNTILSAKEIKKRKLSSKVMLSFLFIVLLQGVLSIIALAIISQEGMNTSLQDQRRRIRLLIENYFLDTRKEIILKAQLLAGQARTVDLTVKKQLDTLRGENFFYLTPLKLNAIVIVKKEAEAIQNSSISGSIDISRILLRRNPFDYLDKNELFTISGEGNRITLWGISPIVQNKKTVGILLAGQNLDRSFIGRIEEISGTSMLLTLRKTIPVNGRLTDQVFIEYSQRILADPNMGASGTIGTYEYRTTHPPDFPDLEMVYFIDTSVNKTQISRYFSLTGFILALTLALAIVMSFALYRFSFAKPFSTFQEAIRKISKGDRSIRFTHNFEQEFFQLGKEFETMIDNIKVLEQKLQLQSRMAAIGEMTAGVAHQLRNPLAVMKVSSEIIREKIQKKDSSTAIIPLITMISSEIESLSELVTKFLDFSRDMQIVRSTVVIADFIPQCVTFFVQGQKPKSMDDKTITVKIDKDIHTAFLDRLLMQQVFYNLLENAIQSNATNITLAVQQESLTLLCTVQDNGCGMSLQELEQGFNPFFTTKSKGTGLGLAIVHRIIDAHGGSIIMQSNQDTTSQVGTKVEIRLPNQEIR